MVEGHLDGLFIYLFLYALNGALHIRSLTITTKQNNGTAIN